MLLDKLYTLLAHLNPLQQAVPEVSDAPSGQSCLYHFSEQWHLLGPFQIGTRGSISEVPGAYSLDQRLLIYRQRLSGGQIHWNIWEDFTA